MVILTIAKCAQRNGGLKWNNPPPPHACDEMAQLRYRAISDNYDGRPIEMPPPSGLPFFAVHRSCRYKAPIVPSVSTKAMNANARTSCGETISTDLCSTTGGSES